MGNEIILVLLAIPFLAIFVPKWTYLAGEMNTFFLVCLLCEGYTMLLVALTPPDAQNPGRVCLFIKSSAPNLFYFGVHLSAAESWYTTENNATC